MLHGGTNTGVYWQVGASATLGSDTDFLGNLTAEQAIGLNSRARILCGRVIALNAALTLSSNVLSNDGLRSSGTTGGAGDFGSFGYSGGTAAATPAPMVEPHGLTMLALALTSLAWLGGRQRGADLDDR